MIARATGPFARRFLTRAFFAAPRLVAALIAGGIALLLAIRAGRRFLLFFAFFRTGLLFFFSRLFIWLRVRRPLTFFLFAGARRSCAARLLSFGRFLLIFAAVRLLVFLLSCI